MVLMMNLKFQISKQFQILQIIISKTFEIKVFIH